MKSNKQRVVIRVDKSTINDLLILSNEFDLSFSELCNLALKNAAKHYASKRPPIIKQPNYREWIQSMTDEEFEAYCQTLK